MMFYWKLSLMFLCIVSITQSMKHFREENDNLYHEYNAMIRTTVSIASKQARLARDENDHVKTLAQDKLREFEEMILSVQRRARQAVKDIEKSIIHSNLLTHKAKRAYQIAKQTHKYAMDVQDSSMTSKNSDSFAGERDIINKEYKHMDYRMNEMDAQSKKMQKALDHLKSRINNVFVNFQFTPDDIDGSKSNDNIEHLSIDMAQNQTYSGVCVFDVDRTLTATQLGYCPNAIVFKDKLDKAYAHPPHIEHNRYSNYPFLLRQGRDAQRAIELCTANNFAVSIATKGSGCTLGGLNYEESKYQWIDELYYNATGIKMKTSDWSEDAKETKPFQCGEFNKDEMLIKIAEFWKVNMETVILFDDKQGNFDILKLNEKTKMAQTVLVSPERNGTTCEGLRDPCCGVTVDEVLQGVHLVTRLSPK